MSMSSVLRRGIKLSMVGDWRSTRRAQSQLNLLVPALRGQATSEIRRGLQCNAAVNAHNCAQIAVEDCLERVLGPTATIPCDFALVFYEGHDGAQVQKGLDAFAARRPTAPPVFGCSLGETKQQRHGGHHPRRQKMKPPVLYGTGDAIVLSVESDSDEEDKGGRDTLAPSPLLLPIDEHSGSESDLESDSMDTDVDKDPAVHSPRDDDEENEEAPRGGSLFELLGSVDDVIDALEEPREKRKRRRNGRRARRIAKKKNLENQLHLEKRMSQRIVTVLGLGFQGRAEVVPVVIANGEFPDLGNSETVRRIFNLPENKPPHFLLLSRRNASAGLERSLERLGHLLPSGTRLAAVSTGERPSVVSSFPAEDKGTVGICIMGDISLQEQAELASKTLGAFSVSNVHVAGGACDELFVPRSPPPPLLPLLPPPSEGVSKASSIHAPVSDDVSVSLPVISSKKKSASRNKPGPSQLCVFKIDDFVYPGMRRRYHIFEPRYRALVKRCLGDGQALLLLPLSGDGNVVGTAAYVSGLYNVREDGRCDIEITGLARCQVKTMWMRGESFGLHEAIVEYFEDDDGGYAETRPPVKFSPEATQSMAGGMKVRGDESSTPGADMGLAAEADNRGDVDEMRGDADSSNAGEEQSRSFSELQQLRVLVSAVLHRELFRTRQTGFSPIWPTWTGHSPNSAAEFLAGSNNTGGNESEKFSSGLADLDAEALSFWAAQHIAVDPQTKLRWLTCTSTEARLRDITARLTDRVVTMARRGGRSAGEGGGDNLYKLLRDLYADKSGRSDGDSGPDR